VLKDAKPQARRALLTSASDELKKLLLNALLIREMGILKYLQKKNKLSKYNGKLRALDNLKISFKSKRKLLIQRGGFIFPLLTSTLSGVIGALMNND
jgi:hypothetical protein